MPLRSWAVVVAARWEAGAPAKVIAEELGAGDGPRWLRRGSGVACGMSVGVGHSYWCSSW